MAKKPNALVVAVGVGKPKGPPPGGPPEGSEEEEALESPEEEAAEPDARQVEEGEYPEFDIPDGLDLGDMKEGDEKEVLATIRMTGEGTACVTKIEGIDLAGGGGPPTEAEMPNQATPPMPMGPPAGGPPGGGIAQRAAASGLM